MQIMSDFVDIRVVSCEKEFTDAMNVRRQVFVDEQKISFDLEFDGNDFVATHIIAYYEAEPVGTVRLRYFKDFTKLERLCVIAPMRKTNISNLLIESCMMFSAEKGYEYIHALCKKELLNRWAEEKFFPIEGAPTVEQNGLTLVPIEKKMDLPDDYITSKTSPEILNLREGEWFEQLKIERSAVLDRAKQIAHFEKMTDKVRTLKLNLNAKPLNWHAPLKYDAIDIFHAR